MDLTPEELEQVQEIHRKIWKKRIVASDAERQGNTELRIRVYGRGTKPTPFFFLERHYYGNSYQKLRY